MNKETKSKLMWIGGGAVAGGLAMWLLQLGGISLPTFGLSARTWQVIDFALVGAVVGNFIKKWF